MAVLMTKILSQLAGIFMSELDAHNESRWFDVNTARTGRLCLASPGEDHASAITTLGDCSSPIENSSFSRGPCSGHSAQLKRLTRIWTRAQESLARSTWSWRRRGILKHQYACGEVLAVGADQDMYELSRGNSKLAIQRPCYTISHSRRER